MAPSCHVAVSHVVVHPTASSQAIKESATELLFGGHETTASTATSLVMFLGLHTEVVERLRRELLGLQEERGVDLQNLDMEALDRLTYTGCVIKETLRINPPVPGGFRVALKTFELNVSSPESHQSVLIVQV